MSKRAKLARKRETVRTNLVRMIDRKAEEGASQGTKETIVSERIAARKAKANFANTWTKRETPPGSFHNPKHAKPSVVITR